MKRMQWLLTSAQSARGLVFWQGVFTAALQVFYPHAPATQMVDAAGWSGGVMRGVLYAALAVGLVDAVVNDMLPRRYVARWAERHRWVVLGLLTVVYVGMVWLAARTQAWPLAVLYAGMAWLALQVTIRHALLPIDDEEG